jgi:hypothetical protein
MRSDGACVLGTPVGDTTFVKAALARRLPDVQAAHSLITEMDDPQIELHLLRACFGYCKVNHLARTVPTPFFIILPECMTKLFGMASVRFSSILCPLLSGAKPA